VKSLLTLIASLALACCGSPLWAGDVEVRTFSVNVENKKAGEFRITALKAPDGVVKVSAESVVQSKQGDGWRRAAYSGLEVWKNGTLQSLDARSYDDGKRREVRASILDDKIRILINGQRSDAPLNVWTSTWWTAPVMDNSVRSIAVLQPETGKVVSAQIERIGLDRLPIDDKFEELTHFRLAGNGLQFDLWYDADDHLVRAAGLENNQHVVMELIKVQR
jgi:hypothetical protein